VLVVRVGDATGARAAAAALACAGSEPDRAGLLIDLESRRAPRPTLIASTAARELEERLAAHLPEAGVGSRGWTCHLTLPADRAGVEGIAAALPLVENSTAAVHLPPRLLQVAFEEPSPLVRGVLLRADLTADLPLTALAAREVLGRGLRAVVLKQPLGWLASRRALAGFLPAGTRGGLPERLCGRLLGERDRELACQENAGSHGDRVAQPRIQFRV
jgi:hypothetical protein